VVVAVAAASDKDKSKNIKCHEFYFLLFYYTVKDGEVCPGIIVMLLGIDSKVEKLLMNIVTRCPTLQVLSF
jgi:hypothetical protein